MSECKGFPMCGDCGYFRVDDKRTGLYKMGWCAKRNERHDRCDLMPECILPELDRPTKPKRKHPHANHLRRVRCIQTGKVYESVTAAANDYGLAAKSLWWAIKYSQNGTKSRTGVEFEYI